MQHTKYGTKTRRAAVAVVSAATVALLATACGPGNDEPAAAGTTAAPAATAATKAPSTAATASTAPSAATSAAPTKSGTTPSAAPATGAASATAAAPTCAPAELNVDAHQAKQRPNGTGIGAAIIAFTNTSGHPCTLEGFPTVAGAANGSPEHNAPLTVTHTGSAAPVRLAPGGKAWVKLTFVQVQGEADGYCVSGATPVAYPTLVVGLPGGAGAHQVGLDEGLFAECDNKVTTTALLATSPS